MVDAFERPQIVSHTSPTGDGLANRPAIHNRDSHTFGKRMRYFAYGSNLNPAVMRRKGVRYHRRTPALLSAHRLVFNKQARKHDFPSHIGYANIEPAPGQFVQGAVYEVSDDCVAALDASERTPEHYVRVDVTVTISGVLSACTTYQAHPKKTRAGLIPSRNYLNHLLLADDVLTHDYRRWLESHATFDEECAICHHVVAVDVVEEAECRFAICVSCRDIREAWNRRLGRSIGIVEAETILHVIDPNQSSASPDQTSPAQLLETALLQNLIDPA